MTAETKKIQKFKSTVWKYYWKHRRTMPWRETRDPYKILVSEMMLQQTQVARVLEKYPLFIRRFPNVRALARAPLSEVLKGWSGLGYNRRAKFLRQAAQKIVREYRGKIPRTEEELRALPGVGESTAGGIMAFAYNIPVLFIETNIRRVFIHHFSRGKKNIPDAKIIPLATETLDRANSREWYYALFDYGTHLAATMSNPNRRSRHYMKQSKFEGSGRQLRGKILRTLISGPRTFAQLVRLRRSVAQDATVIITDLYKEGFIAKKGTRYMLK